ncbi:GH15 family glucan-1,4-alpha-glucosidase [Methylobacterium brachiatum]|uniref:GH15 family glucan-1,4-alpha-glucosidase n=1 Tax=Methylobacterium brachiatum TaxID=269660 RepID=A0AAJ1TNI6_9HYPH|nr:glycoside hydrolase family 15 protein [Methylobacterium brachiatum]MCB4803537.1 glycoside hydrolase family 15 protein [Methylobacterium brachiatum]MDQ0541974.1 GH15 family glucan-1,4-alpha-glucosidase [Methylobacterium brachiatum]
MSDPGERPYQPIEAYALIGNCEGCALVARDGSIDWACLERFDAEPTFSRLLDRRRGGHFTIRPAGRYETTRQYLSRSNILETTFTTQDGFVTLHDFMVGPEGGPDRPRLVRRVSGMSGQVPMVVAYRPLAGFAERFARPAIDGGRVVTPGCPSLLADVALAPDGDGATVRFTLAAGQERSFSLYTDTLPNAPPDTRTLMERTRKAWVLWTQDAAYTGPLADELIRSALVLKALTYAPTGAIVAAATTSLPEEIGGIRNWDYRFCWIRDACLSFYVLKKFGMLREAEAFFGFVTDLCERAEGRLRPLYSVAGEGDLSETTIAHFEGWRGSAPVRAGNEAAEQHQADAYGQVLDLLYLYTRLGGTLPEAMQGHGARLADISAAHWHKPDAGLWEPRKPEQRYLHAAIMNWVALDRAIRLFGPRENWCRERDRIVACVNREGIHRDGYYPQYLGGDDVDAALLMAPMVGFPVDEAAFARTVDVVIERLGRSHLVYRYRNDDGLPGHEGTFLLCAFWLVDALLWLGREEEARTRFNALRALQNDVGLYAEAAADDGTFLGNFPQAFSHLGFIHSALMLDLFEHGGRAAVQGTYADRSLRETALRRVPELAAD